MALPEYELEVIEWVKEQANRGEDFLKAQKGYNQIPEAISYIMGDEKNTNNPRLSDCRVNLAGKIATNIAAALTDFKPHIGSFRTHNPAYEHQAQILNKLALAWWLEVMADIKFAAAVQLAIPAGASYLQMVWNPALSGGKGNVDLIPLDARDVLPINPARSMSIQDSMGVIIRSMETVSNLKATYPHLKDRIKPDVDLSNSPSRSMADRLMSPALALLKSRTKNALKVPGKEVYTVYLKDDSINESGQEKKMGFSPEGEAYNWSYVVQPKEPLYPRGRTIVCSNDIVFYDGPNVYWHGWFPLVKIHMDLSFVYPDTWFSKGALTDIIPIQQFVNDTLNGVADAIKKALKPGIVADKRAISRSVLQSLNTREPGRKLMINPVAGKGIQYEEPPILPPYVFDVMKFMVEKSEYLSGATDMTSMIALKQFPSADSIESLLSAMTPEVRMRGRLLECVLRELAMMLKFNFFEFYNAPRRVAMLGVGGMDFQDFDFDPDTLVPADSGLSRVDRALRHADNFEFFITPNSMLEIALASKKMMYLQLRRMGEVDHRTFLEMLEVPNIQEIDERLGSELDQKIAMLQGGQMGRPPSGQQMPAMEQKGDGRVLVSESP